jgi:hypothetical protein
LAAILHGEDDPDAVVRWIAQALEKETAIGFTGAGAEALGGLEVFSFPSMDARERPSVSVRSGLDGTTEVSVGGLPGEAEYLVQLRATVLNDVVFDEVADAADSSPTARFTTPKETDGLVLRVWKRMPAVGRWVLWHESEEHYLRELRTQMDIGGLSGEMGSPWLDRLIGTRAESRARELRKIRQVSTSTSTTSSFRSSWEASIQGAREIALRLFPEPSDARFFPKGWDGDSKIGFAEWLRDQLSGHRGNVMLIDPYFDTAGLEIVCRASGVAKEVAVLTCSQIGGSATGSRPRADRLVFACTQAEQIVRGIRLRLLDMRSAGGGTKQLFHDRYLLFYDASGHVEKGFNLSNSLQAATLKNPLLVTPIPADVLPDVGAYVHQLLGSDPTVAVVERLYPQEVSTESIERGISNQTAQNILRYASVLHDEPEYAPANPVERLEELGFLRNGKVSIVWTDNQLLRVGGFLEDAPLVDSSDVWCGFAETSVRTLPDDHLLEALASVAGESLRHFLPLYLRGSSRTRIHRNELRGSIIVEPDYSHLLRKDFVSALDTASKLLTYHRDMPVATTWPIFVATRAIMKHATEAADELLSDLLKDERTAGEILSALVSAATIHAREGNQNLLRRFAAAQTPLLRALSAVGMWRRLAEAEIGLDEFLAHAHRYTLAEQRAIISRGIFDSRVEDEKASRSAPAPGAGLSHALFSELRTTVGAGATKESVSDLVRQLAGGRKGHWAISTHENLLVPLVDLNILSGAQVHEIWDSILARRLDSDDRFFYPPADAEFMRAWGSAYCSAPETTRRGVLERFESETRKSVRALREPFSRNRDYEKWQRSADTLLWWVLRLASIVLACPDEASSRGLKDASALLLRLVDEEGLVAAAIGDLRSATIEAVAVLREAEGHSS